MQKAINKGLMNYKIKKGIKMGMQKQKKISQTPKDRKK